jgi:hypothetical protein
MKKILAITLIGLMNFQSVSQAETLNQDDTNKSISFSTSNFSFVINDKSYNMDYFTGEFDVLGHKATILAKTSNSLEFNFSDFEFAKFFDSSIKEVIEEKLKMNDANNDLIIAKSMIYSMLFPYFKNYELVPIGGLTFVLKDSGGFTLEFKTDKSGLNRTLLLRNANGELVSNQGFEDILNHTQLKKMLGDFSLLSSNTSDENLPKDEKSLLKANMHTTQTLTETYAVDYGGIYALGMEALYEEASKPELNYWKDFKNPYTGKTGYGKDGAFMDFKAYKNYKPHPDLKGLVLFQPVITYDSYGKKNICVKYYIYATDETGDLLKDKDGKVFYLSNE